MKYFATFANTEQSLISTEKYINILVSADNEIGVTWTLVKHYPHRKFYDKLYKLKYLIVD